MNKTSNKASIRGILTPLSLAVLHRVVRSRVPSAKKIERMGSRNAVLFGICLVVALTSCVGRRTVNYLNDPSLSPGVSKLFENRKFEYRIQVNDVLSIRVMGLDDATLTGGASSTVCRASAHCSPEKIARKTPVENMGSMKPAASPASIQRSPVNCRLRYE